MIAASLPLSLHKQPQNLLSETLGMGRKRKIRLQKYHQEQESLPQSLRAKRGLKRLQNKGSKV